MLTWVTSEFSLQNEYSFLKALDQQCSSKSPLYLDKVFECQPKVIEAVHQLLSSYTLLSSSVISLTAHILYVETNIHKHNASVFISPKL